MWVHESLTLQASVAEPSVSGVLSPTPTMSRSGPPSPSPAKLRAVTKEPPPAKEPSPPRTDRRDKAPIYLRSLRWQQLQTCLADFSILQCQLIKNKSHQILCEASVQL